MKRATNAKREPASSGGAVLHSARSMFAYHAGAFSGSAAKAATSARGRSIVIAHSTSTGTGVPVSALAPALGGRVAAQRAGVGPGVGVAPDLGEAGGRCNHEDADDNRQRRADRDLRDRRVLLVQEVQ